jgi:hypothetical protein
MIRYDYGATEGPGDIDYAEKNGSAEVGSAEVGSTLQPHLWRKTQP